MTTSPPVRARRAFRDVDGDDAGRLVAMMDATDAWPEVRAARTWVLEQAAVGRGSTVLDVGSGPGTFAGVAQKPAAIAALQKSAIPSPVGAEGNPARAGPGTARIPAGTSAVLGSSSKTLSMHSFPRH